MHLPAAVVTEVVYYLQELKRRELEKFSAVAAGCQVLQKRVVVGRGVRRKKDGGKGEGRGKRRSYR